MKKAIILYQSKTGITKRFAEEISRYITAKGVDTKTLPVTDYQDGITSDADYILLGCWTAGFMLLFQHPDGVWKQFAKKLPLLPGKRVVLFTTYKIATGSMFKSMRKQLGANGDKATVELRSRKGSLSEENKLALDGFLGS